VGAQEHPPRWPLETSLKRRCKMENIPARNRFETEMELLREFQRSYHRFDQLIPKDTALIDWMSLMHPTMHQRDFLISPTRFTSRCISH
jgi:hypothetical protein